MSNIETVKAKLKSLVDHVEHELISDLGDMGREALGCVNVDDDSNGSWGYITVSEYYSNAFGSGSYFSEDEQEFTEQDQKRMVESFAFTCLDMTWDDAERWANDDNYYEKLTDSQKHAFEEYEAEWWGPCLLRVVFETRGYDVVTLSVRVNYSDAPYYQYYKDEILGQIELTAEHFMAVRTDQLQAILSKLMVSEGKCCSLSA